MATKKYQLGDVFAIPLQNNKFGFGRLYKESCIAIYKHIGNSVNDIPKREEYHFIAGVYQDVLKSGKWAIVDKRPFNSEDEAWPPPMCVIDSISGKYSIYHKGEFINASKADCEGLEIAAVWDKTHIIDRIMGDNQ
ncbi:Imm26 family immunity protein [Neobacillus sp. NPDC093127]|uniref:Imm26 family immunity protein n=1 Tax=Neobacillus sp. NPDC093127 TaxID=3364296 RepID=UPI0038155701